MTVRIGAKYERAERPHQVGSAERPQRNEQRRQFMRGRKKDLCDYYGKKAVDDKIEPLEGRPDGRGGHDQAKPSPRGRTSVRGLVRHACHFHVPVVSAKELGDKY